MTSTVAFYAAAIAFSVAFGHYAGQWAPTIILVASAGFALAATFAVWADYRRERARHTNANDN